LKGGKVKYSFILPPKDLRYDVRVLPMVGKIKVLAACVHNVILLFLFFILVQSGKPPKEEITVGVTCKTTVHASCVIIMEIEGTFSFNSNNSNKENKKIFQVATGISSA